MAINNCPLLSINVLTMSSINIRPINPSSTTDHDGVAAAINVAFVEGDSWFKKPECQDRCPDASTIVDILTTPTSTFLLAEDTNTNMILGALRVDWNDETKTGHFGMLGVPTSNAGQGIGKSLVAAAINYLKEEKHQVDCSMPVVKTNNERLVSWYEKQGFECTGETFPFPVPSIVLEEYKGTIDMIQMRRKL